MKTLRLIQHSCSMLVPVVGLMATATATQEPFPSDPEEIAGFITMDLQSDPKLRGTKAEVNVNDGVAILSGRAPSLQQAERAAARAKATAGIHGVVNRLKIAAPTANDATLAERIRRQLAQNPALDARRITVTVDKGTAVLAGKVGTWDEQEIAREIATEIPGTSRVDNRIEVTFDTVRTDRAIRSLIAYQIADDPLHDGLNLDVEVKDGVVRLAGEVGSERDKAQLVHQAHVIGVTEVWADDVRVSRGLALDGLNGKIPSADDTLEALRHTFASDKRLNKATVEARMDDGKLTLSGSAPDETAKAAAESTARGLPGVDVVINRIQVTTARPSDRHLASVAGKP